VIPPTTPDPEQTNVYPPAPSHGYEQPVYGPNPPGFWQHPITRIVIFALITVVFIILLSVGWAVIDFQSAMSITQMKQPVLAISEVIQCVASVAAFLIMVLAYERRTLASTGFTRTYIARDLTIGFLFGGALMATVIVALMLCGVYHPTGLGTLGAGAGLWLLTFLCTAIFEETTFRAYLLRVSGERRGATFGLVVSSIVFGLIHLGNPAPGLTTLQRAIGPIFIALEAGLLMGALYIWTGRIWMSIGLHWAWDFFEGPVFGTGVSGVPAPSFINAHIKGPFVLTGGSFGPEAGLPCLLICTTVALLVIRRARRAGRWELNKTPQPVSPSFPSTPTPLS